MSTAFRLGLFIVLSLSLFFVGVFWIGQKQMFWQSTYVLKSDFKNVAGLIEGSIVRVGGIQQGTVTHIKLPPRPDQKVQVIMEMRKDTRDVIRKDSIASISSEGLVGDKYVEVAFGSPEAPPVENGETIESVPPMQISDLIDKTNGLLDSAKTSMGNINELTGSLKLISAKVNQGDGTVGALINDKTLYKNLNAGVSAMQEDMQAVKKNFLLRGFFKDRGYDSEAELTKNQIAQLPEQAPMRRFSFDGEKLFDKPTTAKLKREKLLDEAGKYLEQSGFGLTVIAASTDMKGDSDKDRTLTLARATVVRKYLVEHFKVDDKKIRTIGLGKSKEIVGASQVDILVFPVNATAAAPAPAKAAAK